jgi:exopolyphosphatase/pppGpp-phosphohydrolase
MAEIDKAHDPTDDAPSGDPSNLDPHDPHGVVALAERCQYEEEHSRQVCRIALNLFDELRSLAGLDLDEEDRLRLEWAAMLHDIGWIEGQKGHHKTSQRMILEAPELRFGPRTRRLVGAIARYHRKATPSARHEAFAALGPEDRKKVCLLSGILRVADGLDRSHQNLVCGVRCRAAPGRLRVQYEVEGPAEMEYDAATEKADLLASVLGCEVVLEDAPAGRKG